VKPGGKRFPQDWETEAGRTINYKSQEKLLSPQERCRVRENRERRPV